MTLVKKITTGVTLSLLALVVVIFCVLFTAPGNKLIAYSANKLVDGLTIELAEGRFLYNDPFDISFSNEGLNFNAQQLKIDLYWWRCDGICIDNLSASKIAVNLPAPQGVEQSTETADNETISDEDSSALVLPINVSIKRIAVADFSLVHPSADVNVKQFRLAAEASGSEVVLDSIKIADVQVLLKPTEAPPSEPLTELAALPDIHFQTPIDLILKEFVVANIAITQAEQSQTELAEAVVADEDQAEQTHVITNVAAAFKMTGDKLSVSTLQASYQQWQLNTELNARFSGNTPVDGKINVTNPAHQAELTINGDLADLQLNLTTQGTYPLTLDATADLRTTNFPFTLQANIKQWLLDIDANQLKVSDVKLTGEGNADDYKLDFLAKSQLGAYPAVALNSKLSGSLTAINVQNLSLVANESKASIQAKANWKNGIESDFTGKLTQLKAQYLTDAVTSDISGQFKGAFALEGEQWQLKMDNTKLAGTVDQLPFTFAADFNLNNKLHTKINTFALKSGENKLTLKGDISEQWQLDGELVLNKTKQEKLPFTGVGEGKLRVRGTRLEPVVNLNVDLQQLAYNDITIAKLALKTDFNYAADWQTNASANVKSIIVAGYEINSVTIDASGDKADHALSLDVDANEGKVQFDLAGKFAKQQWQGALSNVLITDNTVRFTAEPEVAIQYNIQKGDFAVEAHCWQSQNSKLCIDELTQNKQAGVLKAKLDNLELSEFKHFLPENLQTQGRFTGLANANWQGTELKSLTATLNSQELAATLIDEDKTYRLPVETFTVNAQSDGKKASLDAKLSSSVLGDISSQIQLDDLASEQNLSGQLLIDKILFANLQPFVGSLEKLKGQVSGKLGLSGQLSDPLLDGSLAIANINLQGEQLPIALVDSHVDISFDKTTANIDGQLKDPEGGDLNLTGNINWQGKQPEVDVSIKADKFYVRAQQGVTFKVSPDLAIGLANNAFTLSGKVVVPYGRIQIEELPEGAVQVSDDEIIIDKQTQQAETVPFDYDINLKVVVENDVRIDSFGLESKVEGDISIRMDQQTPMIATGELNLREGTYRAFGQDLLIRTGQVGFSGAIDKPYLNIKAIRNPENTSNGVIAGVTLTGNVEQPSLKVFSEPAMDQAQSLAYLLNGQPLDEGDSSTDAMLTQLLLAQGVSRSEGVVSKVGETFGLSDVSLSSKGSGDDTKVEISGYVSPGIQVKYSVGIFDSLSEVAVRYQLLSQLYIEITSGLYQNVDILYKFDWD